MQLCHYRFGCSCVAPTLFDMYIASNVVDFLYWIESWLHLLDITTDNSFCNYHKHVVCFVLVTYTMNVFNLPLTHVWQTLWQYSYRCKCFITTTQYGTVLDTLVLYNRVTFYRFFIAPHVNVDSHTFSTQNSRKKCILVYKIQLPS
jgi:hypothetical protein